jgi:2-polyprenyl-6-methoxyphenol hydroxylase-like FAD-dependent oxidoreductase
LEALLTVGADGRTAITREAAKLPKLETSPPIDVFWFRLPRRPDEVAAVFGRIGPGLLLVMLDRNDYWQVAFVFPKGKGDEIHARGLDAFRADVVRIAPELADRVGGIRSWDEVKLLTVKVDRLTRWHTPGFLAIGDAAHAMSPVGGLGINVAIQDAVAAANVLWRPLSQGRVDERALAQVQHHRERAVRILQALQGFVQSRILEPALISTNAPSLPWIIKLITRTPFLRDIPPRLIALGVDRPHVESPDRYNPGP